MTWAEFQIRLIAYQRTERKEWYKSRLVAYQVYLSNWQSKKKPSSIEKYLPLDEAKKSKITDAHRQAFLQALDKYNKEKNGTT